jgi:hypothetical protein
MIMVVADPVAGTAVVGGVVVGGVVVGGVVVGETAGAVTGGWLGGLPAPATGPASTATATMSAAATISVPMPTAMAQTANLLPGMRPRPGDGVIAMERLLAKTFFMGMIHQDRTQQNRPAGYAI